MSRWDLRSVFSRTRTTGTVHAPAETTHEPPVHGRLSRLAGRARSCEAGQLETLEPRVLLSGDHPSLVDFPTATEIVLGGNGFGFDTGVIENAGEDDLFKFTAPSADFVQILADAANPGSPLDTRLQLYDDQGTLIKTESGSGVLTAGTPTDAWLGFVAEAGTEYFVRVFGDVTDPGDAASTGDYTLRINGASIPLDLHNATGIAIPDGADPDAMVPDPVLGSLGLDDPTTLVAGDHFVEDSVIYKVTAGSDESFDSLLGAAVFETAIGDLDTRIDVYDANGSLIAADSQSAYLTSAFASLRSAPDATFYYRVRSDEFADPDAVPASGAFQLRIDTVADEIEMDPVIRFGQGQGALADANDFGIFRFQAQGTGQAFVTSTPVPFPHDMALTIDDFDGNQLAFADDFAGTIPQVEIPYVGGEEQFVLVTGFDDQAGGGYVVSVEANHTYNQSDDQLVDDHIGDPGTGADPDLRRRLFDLATPIIWSDPTGLTDAYLNPVRDRGLISQGLASGRHYAQGESDLFQFTAPVDMLGGFRGNNDDAGTALFVGGKFNGAQQNNAFPVDSRQLAIWDAGDWFFVGNQNIDAATGIQLGFVDNPATAGTATAEIYAMQEIAVDLGFGVQPALVVGGDFLLNVPQPPPAPPATFTNIALWAYNPIAQQYQWLGLGDTDGPVRAMTTFDPESFDPDGDGPAAAIDDPGPNQLIIGGKFTTAGGVAATNIASLDLETGTGWASLGAGINTANAEVFALATYDPADPGTGREASNDPPLTAVADPPDAPLSLFVGGDFDKGGSVPGDNIAVWNGVSWVSALYGSSASGVGQGLDFTGDINGPVYALTVFDAPDTDGDDPDSLPDPGPALAIGGDFTMAGGVAANNIAIMGVLDSTQDPQVNDYTPQLMWEALGGGTDDVVRALAAWTPPDLSQNGQDAHVLLGLPELDSPTAELLVIGGDFLNFDGAPSNFAAVWDGSTAAPLGAGFDAPVRTLRVMTDAQEPGIPDLTEQGAANTRQVIYAGGDFENIMTTPAPTPVGHVALFDVRFSQLSQSFFFTWDVTREGVDDTVFVLTDFDDQNPAVDNSAATWDRHDKPASRLGGSISGSLESFNNMEIAIYDSTLTELYSVPLGDLGADTISPPFPDPAGLLDPANPFGLIDIDNALAGIQLWGGETYYLEVKTVNGGSGSGRYTVNLTVDNLPLETDGNGFFTSPNSIATEIVDAELAGFAGARNLGLSQAGDASNLLNVTQLPPVTSDHLQIYQAKPSVGSSVVQGGDLGLIHRVDDTDTYVFTAATTGTLEVRVQTLGLTDEYIETEGATTRTLTKTYNSNLDAAIRVFNNDLEQLAYNDDAGVVSGEFSTTFVGSFADRQFKHNDPRIVIPVIEGERYFVQVESGQNYIDGSAAVSAERTLHTRDTIDWRFATGSYQLLVNSSPTQATLNAFHVGDDLSNQGNGDGTPVPLNPDGTSDLDLFLNDNDTPLDTADDFYYTGAIGDPLGVDIDVFTYIAPSDGTLMVTIDRAQTSPTLVPAMTITNEANEILASAAASGVGNAVVSLTVQAGERLNLIASSIGGSTGQYTIDVAGPARVDDHADLGNWAQATQVQLFDFLGSGADSGSIEVAGDTDTFKFQAFDFQELTISANAIGIFDPIIEVYEMSEDPAGNPLRLLIGRNDNSDGTTDASVTVPVSTNRVSLATNNEYPDYFVVVRGSDPTIDVGDYDLVFDFAPTDDHADRGEFDDPATRSLSTFVVIDTTTGQGSDTGVLEVSSDSDVFFFTAPAGGPLGLNITPEVGSTLDAKVTVFDASANEIVSSQSGLPPSVFFDVMRGQSYYVIVEPTDPNDPDTSTGGYTLSVTGPAIDDHPNKTEFDLASRIQLDAITGNGAVGTGVFGQNNPTIVPSQDTDLFTFTAIADGDVVVDLTPLGGGLTMRPMLTIFDGTQAEIASISTLSFATPVTLTITGAIKGDSYFILVEDTLGAAPPASEYTLALDGPAGATEPPPDPAFIDFNNPSSIQLDSRGNADVDNQIEIANDRDLFTFTASAAGETFLQVVTPTGTVLDATLTVLDQPNEDPGSIVAQDAGGIAGATSNLSFQAVMGQQYFVIVDGLGPATGSYTLRVDAVGPTIATQVPEIDAFDYNYRLYYPEGFANKNINEFVSIANPNSFDVDYSIILRYEVGERDQVIHKNLTIAAGSRGGSTLSKGDDGVFADLRENTPYSIEIVSTGPLGATLSHYDFDISTGDSFTDQTSDEWTFARIERAPGLVRDFVVFFNPNPFSVDVSLTTRVNGQDVVLTKTVGALRRGGWDINGQNTLPVAIFGAKLTATPTDSANDGQFIGVVSSVTHYDVADSAGYGQLGDASNGSIAGAITSLTKGDGITSELVLYNPGNASATVDLAGQYIRAALPDLQRRVQIPAKGVLVLSGSDLGLINNQPIGIEYTADRPVSVVTSENRNGDANGVVASTQVGTDWFYGDAYIGKKRAGELYFETLNFYNPAGFDIDVEVSLLYVNGLSDMVTISVPTRGFAELELDQLDVFLDNPDSTNAFAIELTSASPFASELVHYDLFLQGGWGANGAVLGLLNPVSSIVV